MRAPTTTCRSRSPWRSSSPGSARCCAGPPTAPTRFSASPTWSSTRGRVRCGAWWGFFAGTGVARAVVRASFVIYFVVRDQLVSTVDGSLSTTAAQLSNTPLHDFEHLAVPQVELGAAPGYPQLVDANGKAYLPPGETVSLPITPRVIQVARTGRGRFFVDTRVGDTNLRMLTFPYGPGLAVQIVRPLTEVNHSLGRIENLLILIAGRGIAIAAGLGLLASRAPHSPAPRLPGATEHVAEPADLPQRAHATEPTTSTML